MSKEDSVGLLREKHAVHEKVQTPGLVELQRSTTLDPDPSCSGRCEIRHLRGCVQEPKEKVLSAVDVWRACFYAKVKRGVRAEFLEGDEGGRGRQQYGLQEQELVRHP